MTGSMPVFIRIKNKRVGGKNKMVQDGIRRRNFRVTNLDVSGTATGNIASVPAWGKGQVWYVDQNKVSGASGDGTTWGTAFLTVTEGLAAINDYDVLLIAPAYYNEALKMTITGKDGWKIFGMGTGMQWNEGGTMIGDETSTDDILDIVDCKGFEIANLMFYNVTGEKDAINFVTTNSYAGHIHDVCFIGDVGGGTVMEDGIGNAGNCTDLYVHDCKFFRCENSGINGLGQRSTVSNCFFTVPASGNGLIVLESAAGYTLVADNYFLGANSSDLGIKVSAASAGRAMYVNNRFANISSEIESSKDENVVGNWAAGTDGTDAVCNPEE